jgi:cytochrome c553
MLVILALPISATNEENVRGISAEEGGSTKSRQRQLLTAPKLAPERSLGRLDAANRAADAPGLRRANPQWPVRQAGACGLNQRAGHVVARDNIGGRILKIISLQSLLHAAILAIVFTAAGRAEERSTAAVSTQELQAKIGYCKTCHGLSGQGYRGSFPMPRLAGQQPEYLENQLRAFIESRRTNPVMFNVAHVLSPSMLTALAVHFRDLSPKPLGGAPRELVAAGKKIYEEGLPEANIPACSSCHGPEAKGDGAFPRLAGQLHDYIFKKLVNWSKERGQDPAKPDTSAIMEPIAHGLTEPQIAAVAAYLSYLE